MVNEIFLIVQKSFVFCNNYWQIIGTSLHITKNTPVSGGA